MTVGRLAGAAAGALATVSLLVLPAAPAAAHGDLVAGSPGPGDTVSAGADVLRLEFEDLAQDGRAFVTVLDADGRPLPVGDATVLDAETACATTAPLEPGVHEIEYLLDADDGHSFSGRYSFEVVAAGGDAADVGDCAAADLAPATEARTLADFGSAGVPVWLPVGLAAAAVLLVLLVVVRVRRDRAASGGPEAGTGEGSRVAPPGTPRS